MAANGTNCTGKTIYNNNMDVKLLFAIPRELISVKASLSC